MFTIRATVVRCAAFICAGVLWMQSALHSDEVGNPDQSLLLINMPDKIAAMIQQTVRDFHGPANKPETPRYEKIRTNALESLEKLRRLKWPDYSKLSLVKIEEVDNTCLPQQIRVAWIGEVNPRTISMLTSENELVPLPAERYRTEPFAFDRFWKSYRQQLRVGALDPQVENVSWLTVRFDGLVTERSQYDALRVVHAVCLAAHFGKTDDLTAILHRELEKLAWGSEGYFLNAWQHLHDHHVGRSAVLLSKGASFQEIVSHWRETVRLFQDDRLPPVIQRLEQQIVEDRDLKVLDADVLAKMTAAEQARYWVSRFPH